MNPHSDRPFPLGNFEFVAMMAMITAIQALGVDAMLPALGEIADDLHVAQANDRQLVIGLYMVGMAAGATVHGFVADRFGRRRVTLALILAFFAVSLACAATTGFTDLLVLRFAMGFVGAGGNVLAATIVRDRFEGDRMARVQSLVAIVFMTVPMAAPALGQTILLFGSWRAIFIALAGLALVLAIWVSLRLPETLAPEYRQSITPRSIAANFRSILRRHDTQGYIVAGGLIFGGLYGFINTSQQLIAEHFGAERAFAPVFALIVSAVVLTNFVNARIVEKLGARPVSHGALVLMMLSGAGLTAASIWAPDMFPLFIALFMLNLSMVGFTGANFTAIALQPFRSIAGSASSLQTGIRTGGGALIGILIGQTYNDSPLPVALGLFGAGIGAFLLVAYSEKGHLFRRRQPGQDAF